MWDSQQKLFGLITESITETVYYYKTCNEVEFYANREEDLLYILIYLKLWGETDMMQVSQCNCLVHFINFLTENLACKITFFLQLS